LIFIIVPIIDIYFKSKKHLYYYDCHNINRNDIIAFKLKTKSKPFIKIVKGLPNDTLEFKGKYAYINGKLLVNSQGKPYIFSERAKKILSAPLINHKIPNNMYLVLGDKIYEKDSFDSRSFGYISEDQIIGKIVKRYISLYNIKK
jgi:signal peptidase I